MKPCSHPVVLPRHPAIRFKDKSERSVLPFCLCTHCCRSERSVPLLLLYALLQSFVARSAVVPLQPAVIPETALSIDSLLLCHYKQIVIQLAHASFPVLLFWARVQPVHHQLVGHSRSQEVITPKSGEQFQIPNRGWNSKIVWERLHGVRESTPWRDQLVRSEDLRGDLQGNLEKSQPIVETKDDAEVWNDFGQLKGISFIDITSNLEFITTCRKKKYSQSH